MTCPIQNAAKFTLIKDLLTWTLLSAVIVSESLSLIPASICIWECVHVVKVLAVSLAITRLLTIGMKKPHWIVRTRHLVRRLLDQIAQTHFIHRCQAQRIDPFIFRRISNAGQCYESRCQLQLTIDSSHISVRRWFEVTVIETTKMISWLDLGRQPWQQFRCVRFICSNSGRPLRSDKNISATIIASWIVVCQTWSCHRFHVGFVETAFIRFGCVLCLLATDVGDFDARWHRIQSTPTQIGEICANLAIV